VVNISQKSGGISPSRWESIFARAPRPKEDEGKISGHDHLNAKASAGQHRQLALIVAAPV